MVSDTRDPIVCPIETDEQLQKNRKAPANAVSCSPHVHIAPSQVLPAALESTWLNTLSYSFLFLSRSSKDLHPPAAEICGS